jgi:HPt (histidine-containing phosphotransfer) domain-containing protein
MRIVNDAQISDVREMLEDEFPLLVRKYIEDTEATLSEIDILRSTGQEFDIAAQIHRLKSASFQVGAQGVFDQTKIMESYLSGYDGDVYCMAFQTRIDHQLEILRGLFFSYREKIKDYI